MDKLEVEKHTRCKDQHTKEECHGKIILKIGV
jgi:hypothetical protein